MKAWKRSFHANGKEKRAGVAILLSDGIDFTMKNIKRDKDEYYIVIKGDIHQEEVTIMYTHKIQEHLAV